MSIDYPTGAGPSIRYDADTRRYSTTHDFAGEYTLEETVSIALETAAEREGIELGSQLYDVVDPDGLRTLFEPTPSTDRDDGLLFFSLDGFQVAAHADGRVTVEPPEP
jgi:hypothetical protein